MKYPYIPITPLIAEVSEELKIIVKTSQFNDEDMYIWAIDAMRQIMGNNYDNDESSDVYLTVNRHCATLPEDFYLVDNIWNCQAANLSYTSGSLAVGQEPFKWVKTGVLRPHSANDMRYCSRNCLRYGNTDGKLSTYRLQVPPGIVRFGFHTGKVYLKYMKLKTDADGGFMIQDEINGLLFVKNYIKKMLLQEKWILKEITADVYLTFSQDADKFLILAQQAQKFTSPAQTDYLALKQDARYRVFRHKKQ